MPEARWSTRRDATEFHILFPAAGGAPSAQAQMRGPFPVRIAPSGKPMVANDPHLRYQVPGTWYLVHLKAPGIRSNRSIAPGDSVRHHGAQRKYCVGRDEPTSRCDGHLPRTNRYGDRALSVPGQTRAGAARSSEHRRERRQAAPLNIWVTRHGPVFAENGKHTVFVGQRRKALAFLS